MPDPTISHPRIERLADGTHIVQAVGREDLLKEPGVTCLNPADPESERVYQKTFTKKEIFLAHEYDKARDKYLTAQRFPVVFGVNGFSSVKPEDERAWDVPVGGYMVAARTVVRNSVKAMRREFRDANVIMVHGAGPGVDEVASKVASEFRLVQLGFNCPEFMFYVPDDNVPVYVAEDKEAYADAFVRSLDILLCCNGREHAFGMDFGAVLTHKKKVVLCPVIKGISRSGGPPAVTAAGKVQDAVALMDTCFRFSGYVKIPQTSARPWKDMVQNTCDHVVELCGQVLGAEVGLEVNLDL